MAEIGDHKVIRKVKPVSKADMVEIMEDVIEHVKDARDGGQDEYARDKENLNFLHNTVNYICRVTLSQLIIQYSRIRNSMHPYLRA